MSATAHSDQELVRQIRAGGRDAFSTLVERYIHSALAIARARLLNPADADDAVQEAFLRAYQRLATLRDPAKFGPWLLTIARHEAARLVVKGRSTLGADPAATPDATTTESSPSQRELHVILREHVARLPEAARDVLLLHYFAGHSTREIAALLGLRQAAVLKRLQRAREHLAETMLRDLEAFRPNEASLRKQVVRIVALASAVSVQQVAAGTAFTAAASLLFPKAGTIAAGLIGAAVTVAGIAGFAWQSRERPTFAQRDASPVVSENTVAVPATDTKTETSAAAPAAEAAAETQSARIAQAQSAPEPAQTSAVAPPGRVNLDTPVSGEFKHQHLAEILVALEKQTQIRFLLDRRAVGIPGTTPLDAATPPATRPYPADGRIETVRVQNQPLDEALDGILGGIGLKAVLAPGYLWISTPDQIERDAMSYPRERYDNYPGMESLKKPITIAFDDVHVAEVLLFIHEVYKAIPIAIDWRVIAPTTGPAEYPIHAGDEVTDGIIHSINLNTVRLDDALRILARLTNTTLIVRQDYVWLTSEEMSRKDGITTVPPAERTALDKILASTISIGFEGVAIHEIFRLLAESFDINVTIDQRVVAWRDEPKSSVPFDLDGGASGSLSHGMVAYLQVKDLSLESMLDILTHDLDMVFEARGDTVVVSSAAALAAGSASGDSLISATEFLSRVKAMPASTSGGTAWVAVPI